MTERHSGDGQESPSSSSSDGRRGTGTLPHVVVVVVVEDVERLGRTSSQEHPQVFLGCGAVVVDVVHGRITAPGCHRRGGGHVVVIVVVVVT